MPQPFAILRCEKIRDWATLAKSVGHNLRTSADERVHLDSLSGSGIEILHGEAGWLAGWRQKVAGMWLPKLKQGTRHTLAREFFLGASPEFFAGMEPGEIRQWSKASLEWLKSRFGPDRVALCVLHTDEQSPHLAAYVLGLKQDANRKGQINQRGNGWTLSESALGLGGSKNELAQLQDEYAKAMETFGLRRGLKGSKATHKKTAEWRAQMAVPIDSPVRKPRVDPPTLQDRLDPHAYAKRAADAAANAVFQQMKPHHQQLKVVSQEARKLRSHLDRLQPLADAFKWLVEALLGHRPNFDTLDGIEAIKKALIPLLPAPKQARPVEPPPRTPLQLPPPARPQKPTGPRLRP